MKVDTKVLIVGCGAAGVTAAIALARRKIPVLVVEGAVYPGAENWSGAVYFCETLAKPEVLGEELLSQTPIERRIVRRGLLATDGRVAPGPGRADLRLGPARRARVVDAVLTNMHAPGESHAALLAAFVPAPLVAAGWDLAAGLGYRAHELGDVTLTLAG